MMSSFLGNSTMINCTLDSNVTGLNDSCLRNETTADSQILFEWALIVVFIFMGLLCVLISGVNSFVIYLICTKRYLKTATNICLGSLAASDLLAGTVAIPLVIACSAAEGDPKVCFAMDITSRFISFSTVLHLLVVTLERYTMIVYAMKYNVWITKGRITVVLICTWVLSASISLVQLLWVDLTKYGPSGEDFTYGYVSFFGIVVSSLTLMAFSYCRIFIVIKHQLHVIQRYNSLPERSAQMREKRKQRKAAAIFCGMLVNFIVCWFAYFLDGIRSDSDQYIPFWATALLLFLRFTSSFVNPLLYTFLKKDFKRATKSSFRRSKAVIQTSSAVDTCV